METIIKLLELIHIENIAIIHKVEGFEYANRLDEEFKAIMNKKGE